MDNLNYHHLRYFREVAHDGNLTRTAERVNLAQSALSTQIKQLEQRLGFQLFQREGRKLILTEVGRIVLDHADRIFRTGEKMLATLNRSSHELAPIRIGAMSNLSRNFQLQFLRPVLAAKNVDVVLKSGSPSLLLEDLKSLALDVVLTTEPPDRSTAGEFTAHRIADQPVSIHGTPQRLSHGSLRALLANEPLVIPTENSIRTGFDSLVARLDVTPRIAAEVDDMAMVRLLAREDIGLAIAPSVVLADEIASGRLQTAPFDLKIIESFYAVTTPRSFPHPVLRDLLADRAE
ncbi:transcriptional regulator, LysR family [Roseibium hamelinense]|uniref:Transcriptional regulator, LysR family n=1 Tax=Roseibium hamelinense TaxID=150831 RepID=A0A562T3U2_9HYPH|nr:LysR family transcriptional regulator [Roseibium hamelinense]MTI42924.1 LysR family transcriptional regulator [Roseibium hamelinense]TWI87640.1 transcriptional regulator, LysR family [Roseibium hamelinense]